MNIDAGDVTSSAASCYMSTTHCDSGRRGYGLEEAAIYEAYTDGTCPVLVIKKELRNSHNKVVVEAT